MTETLTHIWEKFMSGVRHHNIANMYRATERNYKMYEGDQWYGMPKSDTLPCHNFIKPTVQYKVSMVAMNTMQIMFSPMEYTPEAVAVCDMLNKYAAQKWEQLKLDYLSWQIILDAAIAGDAYIYFYNKSLDCHVVQNTSVYLGDEQQRDIQAQPYIIISERRPVVDILADAKKNKIPKKSLDMIVADKADPTSIGDNNEVDNSEENSGKATSLLYMTRNEKGNIVFARATKYVVYEPEKEIPGLKHYPIASFIWGAQLNSSRGTGEVKPLIPNQFEVNKLAARRCSSAAQNAFAKPVYMKNQVANPEDITKLGSAIELKGNGTPQDIKQIFDYIAPAPMSQEAGLLQSDLITNSRELAGAGSAALGQIDPRRASGDAIMAVVDQASIPMNIQTAAYRQFVEDVAHIFLSMWRVYAKDTNGLETSYIERDLNNHQVIVKKHIDPEDLSTEMSIKIDATATNPYSRLAEERTLEQFLAAKHITLEEYAEMLPYNSTAPKAGLTRVLDNRRRQQELMNLRGMAGMGATNPMMSTGGAVEHNTPGIG